MWVIRYRDVLTGDWCENSSASASRAMGILAKRDWPAEVKGIASSRCLLLKRIDMTLINVGFLDGIISFLVAKEIVQVVPDAMDIACDMSHRVFCAQVAIDFCRNRRGRTWDRGFTDANRDVRVVVDGAGSG